MTKLDTLPREILLQCLAWLDGKSRARAAQVNHVLADAANDEIGYRDMYLRDFASAPVPRRGQARASYKERWVFERNHREFLRGREWARWASRPPVPIRTAARGPAYLLFR